MGIFLEINLILSHAITGLVIIAFFGLFYRYMYKKYARKYSYSKIHQVFQEKENLHLLLDNLPHSVYFKDTNSKFILANKRVATVMKCDSPDELVGKTDYEFYDKDLADIYFNDEQHLIKTGKPILNKEEPGFNIHGEKVIKSTSKIPIKDARGNIIGFIGIGTDISQQKRNESRLKKAADDQKQTNILLQQKQEDIQQMAEELRTQTESMAQINEELEFLSLVASKTDNVVIIMDGNANFLWVNKGFEKVHRRSLKEFIKQKGPNLRENSNNVNISAILNQINITKKSYSYNSVHTNVDGNEKWYRSNISPILNTNKEIKNLILIDSDISDLKHAEIQIKKQKQEIEVQTAELIKTNATKDRLFSIIAHDLKNPFHSILGFSDILSQNFRSMEADKLEEYLQIINNSTNSAHELLENLLDWARTQTNRTSYEPVQLSIRQLVDKELSLLSLHATNKQITFNNELSDTVSAYADSKMIQTVIRNLCSNAIKYTNPGGVITVAGFSSDLTTIIEIADTGIGMTEEHLKKLFHLDRISSRAGTSGETGTGLGLIVCSEFIHINKGELKVDSTPGKGTTFTIKLPSMENTKT